MHSKQEIDKMFRVAYKEVARWRKMIEYMEQNKHIFGDSCISHVRREHEVLKMKFDSLKHKYDTFNYNICTP